MIKHNLGLFKAITLLAAIVVGIFALLDWDRFNGLDLLAVLLFAGFCALVWCSHD